jgi:hypothetical protein
MSGKSRKTRMVRYSADQLPRSSKAELDRLEKLSDAPVDTTDIPEMNFTRRPFSPIRKAIIEELHRQGLTAYRLWKLANRFSPKLPESAVYEFLANKRSVRVDYADAMLRALGIELSVPKRKRAG